MKCIAQRLDRLLSQNSPCGQRSQWKRKQAVGLLSAAVLSTALTVGVTVSPAHAQSVYLVGAYLFGANATGATTSTAYQYDTNTGDPSLVYPLGLTLNGTSYNNKNIAIGLSSGANTFTFTGTTPVNAGSNVTLGLFFSTTATPYNPGSAAAARTPDLAFSSTTNSSTVGDLVPVAGTAINSYYFNSTPIAANGLSSAAFGGTTVAVSNLSSNTSPSGAFTITASAAPEPGSVVLVLGSLPLVGAVLARRKRRD